MRLALPTVCSVSLTASVCQVFGNDCIEFDCGDHPVTVLSGSRTHRRGHAKFAGQNPVHFAKSSCFDVLCHPLSLTFVSVEHIVCPATSTEISTISSAPRGVPWLREDLSASGPPEYSSVC